MIHYVTITSQGQISIPVEIRRQFSLDKRKKAMVEVVGDKIIITPEREIDELMGIFKTDKKIPFRKARQAFEEALARGEA
ncbi:hypothetical protein A2W14_06515 [Candidatus Gottesmanbacteria bacterium RBG_16_37_8]|uniref:SpoVT-AbrB domain-containing protein n=1 Tax=Candidatus Gottesmanbacteria bacterium RBG_16_37_8 TaxID=1798371 RepID=A0A1F5YPX0_9BACT|nr:MAG: hypothetical protein A2W14_06515 [Candidatus Gottesmanbacteria bacterium RBG_16_37_8]